MTKDKLQSFIKSRFFIFCLLYAFIFFIAGFYSYLEILLIPLMLVSFIFLDMEEDFYFFIFTQAFYMSQLLVRPAIISEAIYISIFFIKFIKNRKKEHFEFNRKLITLIAAFTVYTIIISLFHKMAFYSVSYIFYIPFFYIIFITRKKYDLVKTLRILSYSLIISSALALISVFLPYYNLEALKYEGSLIRFRGYFGSANTLYMFTLLALSGFLYLYFSKKIKFSEALVNIILLSVISLSTLSKSAILILAFILFIGVILYLKEDFKKHIWHILSLLILLIIGIFIFKDIAMIIIGRFFTKFDSNIINSLFTGRIDIWKAYCKSIFGSPLNLIFGHGMFSSYAYVPVQGKERAHHNLYLFLLHKFGIVGIILLCLIIIEFIKTANKKKPSFINYLPLIYFLIEGMCDNAFMQPSFYLIIAFVLFADNKRVEKNNQNL